MKKGVAAVLATMAIVFITGWSLSSSTPSKPAKLVGHQTLTLTTTHRTEPVTLHLWYPAQQDGTPGLIGQNALFLGTWASEGATPLPGPHPLVLFSHGSGGNAPRLGWFASALAAQGFVVAAPNHPGTTSGDSDPFQTPMVWQRTADLSATLDRLLTDPPQGLRIDPADITAAGFSLGGHSAMALGGARLSKAAFIAYCDTAGDQLDCGWMKAAGVDFTAIDAPRYEADLSDPRIRRIIAIDPALTPAMTSESLTGLARPTLILNLGTPDSLPRGLNAAQAAALIPRATYGPLPGARHFSALPGCSRLGQIIIGLFGEDDICSDRNLRPRAEIHAEILTATLNFLNPPDPHFLPANIPQGESPPLAATGAAKPPLRASALQRRGESRARRLRLAPPDHRASERQDRGGLDLFHAQQRGDVVDLHFGNQCLIKGVIGPRVLDPDLEDIVDIPGQTVGFQHLGALFQRLEELALPFGLVLAGADQHEEAGLEPQRLGVEDDGLPGDHPRLLHAADAVPDRGLG